LSFSINETDSRATARLYLGLKILTEVVPEILEEGKWLGRRLALMKTWYEFLCLEKSCPNVPSDPKNWGSKEIETIAKALVAYAHELLEPSLRTSPSGVRERRGSVDLEETL